jgi:hypothetical protein
MKEVGGAECGLSRRRVLGSLFGSFVGSFAKTRGEGEVNEMRLVLGSSFFVLGSWFLVLGSWFLVLGSWFLSLES